jgi:hypothetical protein
VFTSGVLATNAFSPRFSPDGSGFAFTRNDSLAVLCDINGRQKSSFKCIGGQLSWTKSGIWIHPKDTGLFVLHDINDGHVIRELKNDSLNSYTAYVSYNETAIGTHFKEKGNSLGAILLDDNNRKVHFGSGCSPGVSPDGQLFTNNLWEKGMEHQTMKIWRRDSTVAYYLKLWEILDYPQEGYSWNDQTWSGTSNDYVIIPAGKKGPDPYQQYGSTVPWIYNVKTGKASCFHRDKEADVFWFPYDYYDGKVADVEPSAPASFSRISTREARGRCAMWRTATRCSMVSA